MVEFRLKNQGNFWDKAIFGVKNSKFKEPVKKTKTFLVILIKECPTTFPLLEQKSHERTKHLSKKTPTHLAEFWKTEFSPHPKTFLAILAQN